MAVSHVMQEKVFKTPAPMTFSPHLVGGKARPSPSRVELWKEQLGLDEESFMNGDGTDSSSDEDCQESNPNAEASEWMLQYQVMQRQLEERNSQRDELLIRIKTLGDKYKHYKDRLQRDESSKRQQIKIMCRTHQTQIQEKGALIRNLEGYIGEQEERIAQLEASLGGDQGVAASRPATGLSALVKQITELQAEKAELMQRVLSAEGSDRGHQQEELVSLREYSDKLEAEMKLLKEEFEKMGAAAKQNCGSTDTEKQLYKLEGENDKLQKELREKLHKLQHLEGATGMNALSSKTLQEENGRLQEQARHLEEQLNEARSDMSSTTSKLKDQVKALTSENQAATREVRTMNAKLTALHAKSPEVVTKFERVEVENEECQEALKHCQHELVVSTSQNAALQLQLAETELTSKRLSHQLRAQMARLESDNGSLHGQLAEAQKEVGTHEEQISALKCDLVSQASAFEAAKEAQIAALRRETDERLRQLEQTVQQVKARLGVLLPEVQKLVKDYLQLRRQCEALPQQMKAMVDLTTKQICKAIADISFHNQDLIRKYKKEMQLRKKYHNELVQLKGNIRVLCRVRPCITEDNHGGSSEMVVSYDQDDDCLVNVLYKGRQQNFELDKVFTAESSQQEVFNEVQALVTSCLDGYNVCIFAYGQTGSGKTYTMEGPSSNPGINQRALQELFREMEERAGEWQYTIVVSVLEIYNEMIRDLLSPDPSYKLEVKMNPDGGLHVPGLNCYQVSTVEDVNEVFTLGKRNRATAATNMNEHSSRSHALLCVTVLGSNLTTGIKTQGKLNLVDLAGSERVSKSGADGTRLKEAQNINKSLSCLGDVIHALRSRQAHVPYRNSKLTYLLQDSLGGDSKTLMIVQVAPVEKNVGETVTSLSFAQRVRCVELGQATQRIGEGTDGTEAKDKLALYQVNAVANNNNYKSPVNRPTVPAKVTQGRKR